jgi:ferredoxin--NADP+ reductase
VQDEVLQEEQLRHVVKRAYSICSPMLDGRGQLVRAEESTQVEFYITLVRYAPKHAPALTPRLFALSPGDRLFVGPHVHGHYTLRDVQPDEDVIFAATGTGEAPHNAMLVQLLASGHRGRIVSATCVRYERDLAYLATHRRLEQLFPSYRYIGLTTREPWNLDPSRADFAGKSHLQDLFASGRIEQIGGTSLDPARTHVFLCGNPAMIGAPQHAHALRFYPRPTGMVEILEGRGFRLDEPGRPGNLHVEKYW